MDYVWPEFAGLCYQAPVKQRIQVRASPHKRHVDSELAHGIHEASIVSGACDTDPYVDASSSERWKQREQVALCAADSVGLADVKYLHGAPTAPSWCAL